MRITNTMMVNNTLSNIAINKQQMSTLDTQLATQKKISRPSEDPIIAIRALRLRSSLNQVTQYLEKNIPDADSWLSVTSGALSECKEIINDLTQYCNQGATDTFATTERDTIAESLANLKEAYYTQGDVDYAGRYVFTGFKTDTTMTYQTATTDEDFTIKQNFTAADISTKVSYSNTVDVDAIMADTTITSTNLQASATPSVSDTYRIRLAYGDLETNGMSLSYGGNTISVGNDGTVTPAGAMTIVDDENYIPADGEIAYNSTTGEILMGKDVYQDMRTAGDISVTYNKTEFAQYDVRPQHYFDCTDNNAGISYNDADEELIYYNVNFSQKLQINTTAQEAFNINLGRDVDDLSKAVQNVLDIEAKQAKVKEMLSQDIYSDEESQAKLTILQDSLSKEHDLAKEAMKDSFEAGITQMQNYQQQTTSADANVGNRQTRLQLTKSRLTEQQTNFKKLKSKNEDVDLEEVVVDFSSAELVYNASLTAASKVVRQTLLDFL